MGCKLTIVFPSAELSVDSNLVNRTVEERFPLRGPWRFRRRNNHHRTRGEIALLAEESILDRDVAGSCHRVLLLFASGYIMKSYLLRRFTPASSSIGPDGWYRNLRHLAIVMR